MKKTIASLSLAALMLGGAAVFAGAPAAAKGGSQAVSATSPAKAHAKKKTKKKGSHQSSTATPRSGN